MVFDSDFWMPQHAVKRLESKKVICWNNGKREFLRIRLQKYTSYQVPEFITRIEYPPTVDREYSMSVYIHYLEYQINRVINERKLESIQFPEYEKLYNEVLENTKLNTEVNRFYQNFLRREDFKHARERGVIARKKSAVPVGND